MGHNDKETFVFWWLSSTHDGPPTGLHQRCWSRCLIRSYVSIWRSPTIYGVGRSQPQFFCYPISFDAKPLMKKPSYDMLLCWNVVRLGALQNNFWLPWKNHMISKLSCMLKLRLAIFLPCHLKSICSYGETRLGVIDICIGETNSFRMHSHWLHSYWSNLGPYANNKVVDQQFIVSTCSRDWFTSWPMPILLEKHILNK